jgi:hypothetical protein
MLSFSQADAASALPVAISLAEQSGSKILVASDRELPESQKRFLSTDSFAPSEYIGLEPARDAKGLQSAARSINRYAERAGAEMIVVPVRRNVFAKSSNRRSVGWIEEFSGKRVVLVSGPSERPDNLEPPRRLLIPVLDEFHAEVLALAGALTSSSRIPDVDIVAAKVIRMPPTVPLYSTYRPESLVDSEKELSFLKTISGLPLLRRLSARVLLVRDISRDLLQFAEEKRVDMIILRGDWAASRHGFLPKRERIVAAKASCSVAVLLPSEP